jgi:group I intron endonuclease
MKHNQQRWGSIYKIVNIKNAKCYFGKTIHFKERMRAHRLSAKKATTHLARAIKKHGWENFNVEILIRDVPEEDLSGLEKSYIEIFDAMNPNKGYNLTRGGDGTSGWVPSEEWRKKQSKRMKMQMSNRDQFGSITYNKTKKVYTVFGPQNGKRRGTYIGQYDTKEEAKNALEIFNKTGQKTVSTRTGQKRKRGSGSICVGKHGRFRANFKNNHIGYYASQEKAEKAIQHFIQTGETLPSGHKRKIGCISKENGRFRADFKGTYIGCYVSQEKAENALQHFIQTGGEKLTSSIKKRTGSIRKYKSRFQASYKNKYLGTYSSEQEAEEAIEKHLSTAHTATASTTTSV